MAEREKVEVEVAMEKARQKLEFDIRLAQAALELLGRGSFANYLSVDWGNGFSPYNEADQHARNFVLSANNVVTSAIKGEKRIPVTSYKRDRGVQDSRVVVHGPVLMEAIRIWDGGTMADYELKVEDLPSFRPEGESSDLLVFVKK